MKADWTIELRFIFIDRLCHLYLFVYIIQRMFASGDMPPLIDSLVITLDNEGSEVGNPPNGHDDSAKREEVMKYYPTGGRQQQLHQPNTVSGAKMANETDTEVSPSMLRGLDDSNCPKIFCFIHRYYSTSKLILDCKETEVENKTAVEYIDCFYRMSPTSPTGTQKYPPTFVSNDGRGYDLKITLTPSRRRRSGSAERRVTVDYLANGVLGWVVEAVRRRVRMAHSPVHLILPFIQFAHIRRADVGDLSTRHRVTRLTLWNPLRWNEDSLIPAPLGANFASYVSPKNPSIPPYFRLNVFCDHINRKPSFKRLWLPWESWQIRFNHCQGKYGCLAWLSPYPICDSTSQHSFMPSFFIMPLVVSSQSDLQSLNISSEVVASRYKAENEILFENQCRKEPTRWDPVGDLVVDHTLGCWRPNAYVDIGSIPVEGPSSVLFIENPTVAPEMKLGSTSTTQALKPKPPLSSSYTSTTEETTTTVAATEHVGFAVVSDNQSTHVVDQQSVYVSVVPSVGGGSAGPDTQRPITINPPPVANTTDNSLNLSLPWFMQPFVKHQVSGESRAISDRRFSSSKELNQQTEPVDTLSVRNLTSAVIFLSVLVILLLSLLIILLVMFQKRRRRKRKEQWQKFRGFLVGSQSIEPSGFVTSKAAGLKGPLVPIISEPIPVGGRAAASAHSNDTSTSGASLAYSFEPLGRMNTLQTFGPSRPSCMDNNAYSCSAEREKLSTDTDSTSTTRSHHCLSLSRSHLGGILPPPKPNSRTNLKLDQDAEDGQAVQALLTKLKQSAKKPPRKQHTLVFEDGELSQDKLPEGLRHSYSLIKK
ncbi:unnamed protein product [Dicrocoelium dendriticum]|nr:unnamed protein product [Dicrocoelium dendriticum]